MSNATANPKSAQRVILSPEMTAQEAMSHVASGAVPVEAYLEWDADRIKRIEAKARAQTNVKAFRIGSSDKGVLTISLPGMAMPIAPPVEAVEALLANVDAIRAYLAEHGEALRAKRAAYKQSPEYL